MSANSETGKVQDRTAMDADEFMTNLEKMKKDLEEFTKGGKQNPPPNYSSSPPAPRGWICPVTFFVVGSPAPQPRPRFAKGRVISCINPKAIAWGAAVKRAARVALESISGTPAGNAMREKLQPLALKLEFMIPLQNCVSVKQKKIGTWHIRTPDVDNLAKLVMDTVMRTKMFHDDSQIARLEVTKRYARPKDAGCQVSFWVLDHEAVDTTRPEPAKPAWVGIKEPAFAEPVDDGTVLDVCELCDGRGNVRDPKDRICPQCLGAGAIRRKRKVVDAIGHPLGAMGLGNAVEVPAPAHQPGVVE